MGEEKCRPMTALPQVDWEKPPGLVTVEQLECFYEYRPRYLVTCSSSAAMAVSCLLNGVDYIESGGFGILVGLFISAKKRGGDLKLVSPNERITEVLRHTNLVTIFKVYGKDNEAVAGFRKQV